MSMRVLIVDADWYFLRQVRDFLDSRGHLTLHEPDPADAVERARRWRPDLVIVPAETESCCDGDLLERLGSLQPRPAVLLTAHLDGFAQAWRAWQRGGDELLFKPLMHPSELHVAVVAALENSVCPSRRRVPAWQVAKSA